MKHDKQTLHCSVMVNNQNNNNNNNNNGIVKSKKLTTLSKNETKKKQNSFEHIYTMMEFSPKENSIFYTHTHTQITS